MTADESTGLVNLSSPKTRSRVNLPEFAAPEFTSYLWRSQA